MIRMNQIKIRAGKEKEKYNPEYKAVPEWERKLLESKIRKQLRLKEKDTFTFEIIKRSIDARKKPDIFYSYTVDVDGLKERDVIRRVKEGQVSLVNPVKYRFPSPGNKSMGHRPVIVGTGPAGLFCGYMLAIHGYRPVLLERGMEVEKRCKKVEEFWKTGKLDEECNVQFGEGGAGTFSMAS